MKPVKMISGIIGAIGLIIVIATAALAISVYGKPFQGEISLVNKATEPITRVSVSICGQVIELEDIQPTKNAVGSYKVTCEGHYDIRIEFQSGKKFQKEIGYVTGGFNYWHEILVTDSGIEIGESKVEK